MNTRSFPFIVGCGLMVLAMVIYFSGSRIEPVFLYGLLGFGGFFILLGAAEKPPLVKKDQAERIAVKEVEALQNQGVVKPGTVKSTGATKLTKMVYDSLNLYEPDEWVSVISVHGDVRRAVLVRMSPHGAVIGTDPDIPISFSLGSIPDIRHVSGRPSEKEKTLQLPPEAGKSELSE